MRSDYSIIMATMAKGGADKGTCASPQAARTMKNVGKLPDTEILHSDWAVHGAHTNATHDNIFVLMTIHNPQWIQSGFRKGPRNVGYYVILLSALNLSSKIHPLFLTAEMYTLTREQ
jgi:hypothetical protein